MNYRICFSILVLLCACSPEANKPPAPKLAETPRAVLEKAKTVDQTQQQHEEEQQKTINQQSQ